MNRKFVTMLMAASTICGGCTPKTTVKNPILEGADPFILVHDNKYYLYCTGDPNGFKVYESSDLASWEDKGYALYKDDVMGDSGFWAPELMYRNGLFYMVYVANEHLGIATATSPLGPFTQTEQKWINDEKMIDGHFLQTDEGVYLYYVRFHGGNFVHAAKMNDDLLSVDFSTDKLLVSAEEPWETAWGGAPICEGPFVLKHDNKYYLTYSCNHTKDGTYAMGYAVSDSPLGTFVKASSENPILHAKDDIAGTGHHSFFTNLKGELMIVYHRHYSATTAYPRKVCIDRAGFTKDGKLEVYGPTNEFKY